MTDYGKPNDTSKSRKVYPRLGESHPRQIVIFADDGGFEAKFGFADYFAARMFEQGFVRGAAMFFGCPGVYVLPDDGDMMRAEQKNTSEVRRAMEAVESPIRIE